MLPDLARYGIIFLNFNLTKIFFNHSLFSYSKIICLKTYASY